jgi:hypothetical protein
MTLSREPAGLTEEYWLSGMEMANRKPTSRLLENLAEQRYDVTTVMVGQLQKDPFAARLCKGKINYGNEYGIQKSYRHGFQIPIDHFLYPQHSTILLDQPTSSRGQWG